jgi:cysteinyl-tRNA synthetase
LLDKFDAALSEDLNTAVGLTLLEEAASMKKIDAAEKLATIARMDAVLGLNLMTLDRTDLRVRPANARLTAEEIEAELAKRKDARANKDFATSDAIRDALLAKGVEVMDGDPLGWDWKIEG